MQSLVASRSKSQATPERWARALDRALHAGIEIYTTPSGERFASSASHLDLIYPVTETECACQAGLSGDPVCQHRAALRSILGTLPVLTLRIDELVPADAPRCSWCFGKGERWAGSVDDERNPQRFITCPECGGTGHNLDSILRITDAR